MFRFVSTDFDNHPEEVLYLEKIASQTIVEGLRACYQLKADDNCFWMMIEPYFPENFFSGFAQYVGMKDDTAAGITFIREKVRRYMSVICKANHGRRPSHCASAQFGMARLTAYREDGR
ncbi:MAG: hypothetical protein LUF27_16640 [Lachnospiraceae bacterium]|nr:hypothetical protein [Lachnospiraceae bacterium]